ncbi:MAG: hypothetical protein VKN56_11150 [Cyanobacteriota bacterium]|nr:hypothetical protein [Cyanobacteriota bacterium]
MVALIANSGLADSCPEVAIPPQVSEAASRYLPETRWDDRTIIWVDVHCHKKPHAAIVGTTTDGKQVAIFSHGLTHPPKLLQLAYRQDNAIRNRVKVISGKDLARLATLSAGVVPVGLGVWDTCEVLRLDDGEVDAVYIYWNHRSQQLDYWQN